MIQLSANYKHSDGCLIRVDNAPGFQTLKDDKMLKSIGIDLDFGRIKNKNSNVCLDKRMRELVNENKRMVPEGGKISSGTLALAISNLNHRIQSNGLSSKEISLKRGTFTSAPLNFNDEQIQNFKSAKRLQNHLSSELSKSRGSTKIYVMISEGDIVHIKDEGTKHHAREFYFLISINYY